MGPIRPNFDAKFPISVLFSMKADDLKTCDSVTNLEQFISDIHFHNKLIREEQNTLLRWLQIQAEEQLF